MLDQWDKEQLSHQTHRFTDQELLIQLDLVPWLATLTQWHRILR